MEPLAGNCAIDPAHVVEVHLQMDATDAEVTYLVYWTMLHGVAVYRLERSEPLIGALRAAAAAQHGYLVSVSSGSPLDLWSTDKLPGAATPNTTISNLDICTVSAAWRKGCMVCSTALSCRISST